MNDLQKQQLEQAIGAVRGKKFRSVYFVACGGSKATFGPAQYIFDSETDLPAFVYTSNEFNYRRPKGMGKDSLVITCSHSGNTPETVEATKIARKSGALTICLSHKIDSELWEAAEYGVSYLWGQENKHTDSKDAMLYRLIFGILNELYPNEKYTRAIEHVDLLDGLISINKQKFYDRARAFGETYKRDELIYTMSSGECYSTAYSFALCLLMEMQWIHSHPIHTGEYFHGPFEVTDYDVPFLIIMNRGKTRHLDERALAFAQKYSEDVTVLDTKEFEMGEIKEDLQGYFAALIVSPVIRQYADALADFRGHPLSVRRYMWRMEY